MWLHHFFLKLYQLSVIVEYNAVGVENIVRENCYTFSTAKCGSAFNNQGDELMYSLTDKEIMKASDSIDKALASATRENRGEIALRIVMVVRNLNDHVADKIWKDLCPNDPRSINKVASFFSNIPQYKFIARFNKFLQASVSHFTPSEEGAERLMIKYYQYLLRLKKAMYDRYGIVILKNVDKFLEDLDEQTKDYYRKIASQIEFHLLKQSSHSFDNYYVDKIKPFFVNHEIYYEVVLEPAGEKPNKFNRITAFTKCEITSNYCVALAFADSLIDVFNVHFPIKIITAWQVSIRPCELSNFANLLGATLSVNRGHKEYKALMDYLEQAQVSLVDIIDYDNIQYAATKQRITATTQKQHSFVFDILDKCREISLNNRDGKNILRYLLYRMNNRVIKDQLPHGEEKCYAGLNMSGKCMPFDRNPYSFNPRAHISNLYDLFECINPDGHKKELLARHIEKNTNQKGILFTPITDLKAFGTQEEIKQLIEQYNNSLFRTFRPTCELGIYREYVYSKGSEITTVQILKKLLSLSAEPSALADLFSSEHINTLKALSQGEKLDDDAKEAILNTMFSKSKVHFVYGAAGTGKTTLVNHVSQLTSGKRKAYLAKTHPAKDNLSRKVTAADHADNFVTIDRFTRKNWYASQSHELIVVDECSTIKNDDIIKVLNQPRDTSFVLVGDTYQIEAIGFGNWFSICRLVLPEYCCHELTIPHRSPDEHLKKLWQEVRNMDDDNTVLEKMVRSDYSHPIDGDIFDRRADDEIILCLNYNGLYGLNNINRLLQLNNPNPAVNIGIWQFKTNDPILFNDSNRFDVLYNNLKGKIISILDCGDSVYFTVVVDIVLNAFDVLACNGLSFINSNNTSTTVGFWVNRTKPYSSDEERASNEHVVPFQIAYAVSIHKAQGLEYDSVKIVIADETEDQITHNIFYTAVTRAKKHLTIYWSPEVCNRTLARIRPIDYKKDFYLLKAKNNL